MNVKLLYGLLSEVDRWLYYKVCVNMGRNDWIFSKNSARPNQAYLILNCLKMLSRYLDDPEHKKSGILKLFTPMINDHIE